MVFLLVTSTETKFLRPLETHLLAIPLSAVPLPAVPLPAVLGKVQLTGYPQPVVNPFTNGNTYISDRGTRCSENRRLSRGVHTHTGGVLQT